VAFQDGNVKGISRGEQIGALSDLPRSKNIPLLNREDIVDDLQHQAKRRGDRFTPLNRRVPVKNFLQHLGVRYEAFARSDQALQQDSESALYGARRR